MTATSNPTGGQEWVRTYLLDTGVTFSDDRRILETWLTGGRFPLQAVATGSEDLITLAKKGIPIKQIFLPKQVGLIRAGGSGCCISAFANAPHPNGAKLFVNWFLSKEGQTLTHTMIPTSTDHRCAMISRSGRWWRISAALQVSSTGSRMPIPNSARARRKRRNGS